MTLPTTTAALKAWLVDVTLSTVAADLSWTSASAPVEAAVDLTALVLGHTVETEASSGATQKLIDIATWRAWEQAVQALARNFDAKSGGGKEAKLAQAYDHAAARLADARLIASRWPEAVSAMLGGQRRPVVGQITTTAPATPLYPPNPNNPIYAGRPAGWWP
jgi:hypothetical protein